MSEIFNHNFVYVSSAEFRSHPSYKEQIDTTNSLLREIGITDFVHENGELKINSIDVKNIKPITRVLRLCEKDLLLAIEEQKRVKLPYADLPCISL
jgi:hypothetical protein